MSISWGYYLDPQDESVSERTLQRAVELGVTHFDTASLYGRGHNETLVGRALRDRPAEVLIASKCGLENRGFPRRKTVRDGRPETIRRQCEGSLARLGLDVLDLYYLHRVDPDVPVEESFGTLSELVAEGKIRRLGHLRVHGRGARARPRDASRERAAERVLAVDARAARRRHPVVRRQRRRRSWPSACSAAAS